MERITFDKQHHKEAFRRLPITQKFAIEATGASGTGKVLKGYAAVWDVLSVDRGGYLALFPSGSMQLPDYAVECYYNHNDDYVLATERTGRLAFGVDSVGLSMSVALDDTFIDQYVATKVGNGTIAGMSLGMFALQLHRENRVISEADANGNSELLPYVGKTVPVEIYDQWVLDEITITSRPAFPQTSIATFARAEGTKEGKAEMINVYEKEAEIIGLLLD